MQIFAHLFTRRTLTGTVLIGQRAAFGRGHRYALQSEDALHQRLTRLRDDPGAMQRLRTAAERFGGGAGFAHTSDAALIARLIPDSRRGPLAAWAIPDGTVRNLRQPDVARTESRLTAYSGLRTLAAEVNAGKTRLFIHSSSAAFRADPPRRMSTLSTPTPVRLDVAGMTIEARLAEILHRATRSDRLSAEIVARLEAMIAPAEIAKTVAILAVWAGSHAVGIGFFVDLLLLGSGLYYLGWAAIEAARNLKKFVEIAVAARTEAELDVAADLLAAVIVTVGIRVLEAAIRRGGVTLTGGRQARGGGFDKRGDAPAPARAPAPKRARQGSGAGASGPPAKKAKPDDGGKPARRQSKRDQYLGKTPGKSSKTGQAVRERMRAEGKLRTDPRTGKDAFKAADGRWYPVDSPQTHMGHHPVDAVEYWNTEGRQSGPKSKAVRTWMRDPDNYRFEFGPENSSRGGQSRMRYQPPTDPPPK